MLSIKIKEVSRMMKNIVILLRPQQWLKNGFIFIPLFFDQLTGIDQAVAICVKGRLVRRHRRCRRRAHIQ